MSSNDLSILADHMGHNINIHTDIYRLQSSVLERTKVAKMLVAVAEGNMTKRNSLTAVEAVTVDDFFFWLSVMSDDDCTGHMCGRCCLGEVSGRILRFPVFSPTLQDTARL